MAGDAMTDQQRARALSGATRGCLWVPTDIPAKEYERRAANLPHDAFCQGKCKGTGRVFILDERARWECNNCRGAGILMVTEWVSWPTIQRTEEFCSTCGGSGWLTTLVIEEPCRACDGRGSGDGWGCMICLGFGTITRPDTDQIIAVMEAAGYQVSYNELDDQRWGVSGERDVYMFPNILVAACKALGSEEPCQPR